MLPGSALQRLGRYAGPRIAGTRIVVRRTT